MVALSHPSYAWKVLGPKHNGGKSLGSGVCIRASNTIEATAVKEVKIQMVAMF